MTGALAGPGRWATNQVFPTGAAAVTAAGALAVRAERLAETAGDLSDPDVFEAFVTELAEVDQIVDQAEPRAQR